MKVTFGLKMIHFTSMRKSVSVADLFNLPYSLSEEVLKIDV